MENQAFISDQHEASIDTNIDEQKIISLPNFILLSVLTFGLYEIWWMYKAWRFYQQKEKSDIMPAARAIFCIFFIHSLFEKILSFAKQKGYSDGYSSTPLVIGYIILNFMAQLPDPYWLVSLFSLAFLIAPFKAFNFARLNSTEFQVEEQKSFNTRQIVLIVLGSIFWCLVLIGLNVEE